MELNDAISQLLKEGVEKMTFGYDPKSRVTYIACEQVVKNQSNLLRLMHEGRGDNATDAFNEIIKGVKHCAELQATLVKVGNGR